VLSGKTVEAALFNDDQSLDGSPESGTAQVVFEVLFEDGTGALYGDGSLARQDTFFVGMKSRSRAAKRRWSISTQTAAFSRRDTAHGVCVVT